MDDSILLDIQNQLGRIEATTTAVKEDIAELKKKDIEADQKLEQAYQKAMDYAKTRQDNIREDLQHQIDNNKTLILTVSKSINDLNTNIEKVTTELKDSLTEKIGKVEKRVEVLETRKEKTLAKWYDRIVDKLVWVFVIGAIVVLLKWLNAPPEVMSQLPH